MPELELISFTPLRKVRPSPHRVLRSSQCSEALCENPLYRISSKSGRKCRNMVTNKFTPYVKCGLNYADFYEAPDYQFFIYYYYYFFWTASVHSYIEIGGKMYAVRTACHFRSSERHGLHSTDVYESCTCLTALRGEIIHRRLPKST